MVIGNGNPRPSLPLSCDRPANHPRNPEFRARVYSAHCREFTGDAGPIAQSLGISESTYWEIVESFLPYDV